VPIYEFWCISCRKKSSIFVRTVSSELDPACQHCGGKEMQRAVSHFAYHKSAKTRMEEAGDPNNPSDSFYDDPRNIGRWVEDKWQQTMGEEPIPGEIQEMIGTAREGEMPSPLPNLPDFPNPLRDL